MKKQSNKKGFTIIEVVLVLAIAGLIFLMVFVALPALQRSQRDTQRRNDLARVSTSLTQYQTNNQNTNNGTNLPGAGTLAIDQGTLTCGNRPADYSSNTYWPCSFVQRYMNSGDSDAAGGANEFQDPDGTYYGLTIAPHSNTGNVGNLTNSNGVYSYNKNEMDHVIYVITSAKCDGETAVDGSSRDYAVLYRLEGSGLYCIDDR